MAEGYEGSTATEAVRRALRRQLDVVYELERAVRADEHDAVHDVRVAMRRMRSFLAIFRPVLNGMEAKRLGGELRWAGRQLAAARDLEVLAERFRREFDEAAANGAGPIPDEVQRLILDDLGSRREVAVERAVEALDRPRWAAMKRQARAFVEPGAQLDGTAPAERELSKLARRSERRVASRTAVAETDPEHLDLWHEVRKAVKSTRYAWEVVAELPDSSEHDLAEAERWKLAGSAFGELQDTSVALDVLDDYLRHARLAGRPLEPYLVLRERMTATAEEQLAEARRLLTEARSV